MVAATRTSTPLWLLCLLLKLCNASPASRLRPANYGTSLLPKATSTEENGAIVAIDDDNVGRTTRAAANPAHPFQAAIYVSVANLLLNTLRPDPGISWNFRLPRVLWELSIAFVATTAGQVDSPTLFILLSIMLITTSLVDIFLWAPLFASFASFESCTGGWFTGRPRRCYPDHIKGFGRLLVVPQCLLGGLIYLSTGIEAWNCFLSYRDDVKLDRDALLFERLEQQRHHHQDRISR